jgi:hypothetical protein
MYPSLSSAAKFQETLIPEQKSGAAAFVSYSDAICLPLYASGANNRKSQGHWRNCG